MCTCIRFGFILAELRWLEHHGLVTCYGICCLSELWSCGQGLDSDLVCFCMAVAARRLRSAVGLAIFTILPFLYIVPAGLPEVELAIRLQRAMLQVFTSCA